ncbi:MAG: LemA family protein, partial [Psychrobacter alimentarius]
KVFGMQPKPNFSVANEEAISTAPSVDFGGDDAATAE